MTAPPARRRVVEQAPVDRSKRNVVVLMGAIVGIAAGAFAAFFVAPPLIDRFFGTADIELGEIYRRDGSTFRLTTSPNPPSVGAGFEVVIEVGGRVPDLPATAFVLETRPGGRRLTAAGVEHSGGPIGPQTITLVLVRFPTADTRGAAPAILHVAALEVRFHLRAREPE